ncbi:MAG: peptidylprolyl isomerase [candidate division KSB1 bacterium]|nr:peptidylprolyl isomerase [candidate division KSB1 bacterium]
MGKIRLTLLLLMLIVFCSRHEQIDVLVRVGNRIVTVDDLTLRAEFSPERFLADRELTREELLEALIDEKRLAMAAEKRRLHRDSYLQQLIEFAEDLAIMRELFRVQVADRVRLQGEQIEQALNWSRQERRISYLAFLTIEEAEKCRSIWEGNSLSETLRRLGRIDADTLAYQRVVKWGEREGPLETAVFSLEKGRISPVVQDDGRYYLLRLDDVRYSVEAGEYAEARRRTAVEHILRVREQSRLSRLYVAEFMQRQAVHFDEALVRRIIDVLTPIALQESKPTSVFREVPLSESAWERARRELQSMQSRELVRFNGGRLTVQAFLQKWSAYRFPIDRSSSRAVARSLNDQFSLVIRDHLLTREGRRRGLQKSSAVRQDLARWRDHYLAEALAEQIGLKRLPVVLDSLRQVWPVQVDSSRFSHVELTDIPLIGLRPGQYASRVTPPWPSFFKEK